MKGKINSAIFFNAKQNGHNVVNNLGVDRRESNYDCLRKGFLKKTVFESILRGVTRWRKS